MATYKLLLLPGDGIGPEVMAEVEKVVDYLGQAGLVSFEVEKGLVGGCAYDAHGVAISEGDMALARGADAILLAAVGGPKWNAVPYEARPEAGLLRLRKDLGLFANLRPAICYPALADASSLKREIVEGLDIMIVRELTGGVYFGEPKQIIDLGNGQKRGIDTQVYDTFEIERIGRVAFDLARKRANKVTSSEKRNVMKSGVLWNEVMTALGAREFPDVTLEHQLADALGMQLVRWPKQFDVIVTDNLFGDMLSDVAAMLTGSLGMLPSASLGETDPQTGRRKALYEPVHGSAPDIAGKGRANPIAMIGSLAMALRYSFGLGPLADRLEKAIADVLAAGLRTPDIRGDAPSVVSTTEMGNAVLASFQKALGEGFNDRAAGRFWPNSAGAAILAWCAAVTSPANGGPLEAHLSTARPVVVFGASVDDPQFRRQIAKLRASAAEVTERDIAVIEVPAAGDPLRERLQVPAGRFAVVLVGKDGGEKQRWTQPVDVGEIFATVDAMPMRQREMRSKKP